MLVGGWRGGVPNEAMDVALRKWEERVDRGGRAGGRSGDHMVYYVPLTNFTGQAAYRSQPSTISEGATGAIEAQIDATKDNNSIINISEVDGGAAAYLLGWLLTSSFDDFGE